MFGATTNSFVEQRTIRQVTWRIIPFLMVCYFIAFVDRVNAGFAALQMNHDVGLSSAALGLGGGLFYITYVLLEVPSNIAMESGWLPKVRLRASPRSTRSAISAASSVRRCWA